MPNIFKSAKVKAPGYSWFDLSHEVKFTFEIGKNVPALNVHQLSGDRFVIGKEHLLRFMPMLSPVFQRFDLRFDTCFIPERIVWTKSKDFYRGGKTGTVDVPRPNIKLSLLLEILWTQRGSYNTQVNYLLGTLYDYFGLPCFEYLQTDEVDSAHKFHTALTALMTSNTTLANTTIDLIPFFCYQTVYREYYRDQFVQENTTDTLSSGTSYTYYLPEIQPEEFLTLFPASDVNDSPSQDWDSAWSSLLKLRDVDFPKDYFTSAFPSPQLGADVQIPISSTVKVGTTANPYVHTHNVMVNSSGSTSQTSRIVKSSSETSQLVQGNMTVVNSGTIRDLRNANRLQEYNEKGILGGNRFIDWILAHFGVHSSDARLDRPEMISRSKSPVTISDVTATSSTAYGSDSASQPLGYLGGQAISVSGDKLCDYFAEEPGWLQIYVSCVPKAAYFQGIQKEWFKTDRFDYLIPEFAEIGEQPILKKELFAGGSSSDTDATFGYTERYAEYKYLPSRVAGDMRFSMSYWHDARMFGSVPSLSDQFLRVDAKMQGLNRIFTYVGDVESTDDNRLLIAIYFDIKAYRALPLYPRYQL